MMRFLFFVCLVIIISFILFNGLLKQDCFRPWINSINKTPQLWKFFKKSQSIKKTNFKIASWNLCLRLIAPPTEHIDWISFGTFLTNYDITTAEFRTAEPWGSLSYGTKKTLFREKLPTDTFMSRVGVVVVVVVLVVVVLVGAADCRSLWLRLWRGWHRSSYQTSVLSAVLSLLLTELRIRRFGCSLRLAGRSYSILTIGENSGQNKIRI